jgi:hypothetical protein
LANVAFAFPDRAFLREYERGYVRVVSNELRQCGHASGLLLTERAETADVIVILQSAQYKTIDYLDVLESDPLVRHHAERVFVIDYDDHPEGMLSGLYTSIEAPFYASALHKSWPILFMNNQAVYQLSREQVFGSTPSRLFSFVGAASHAVREELVRLYGRESATWHVRLSDGWYNHSDHDRTHFVRVALDSLFCLCPRGYASYTNRIPEVMAMGRVPVIIADDWVPFDFPEKVPYYVRVAENAVDRLPELLSASVAQAEELRHNARTLWERHCSEGRRTVAAVEAICDLAATRTRPITFAEYRDRWRSRDFLRRCGWTRTQRLALRARQHLQRLRLSRLSRESGREGRH